MTIRVRTAAVAIAVFCFTVLGMASSTLAPAHAESGDSITAFKVDYVVAATGVVHVKETITYSFGGYGRHGIYRNLVTREVYADDKSKDQLYEIDNIRVATTTPGVSDDFTKKTLDDNRGRDQNIQLKIGSADQTLNVRTATYVISYDVRGALRHFSDHSEFFWDVTGSGWDVDSIKNTSVTVAVPKGVTEAACFAGVNSKATCTSSSIGSDGVATFTQASLVGSEQLTVDAGITAGAVANDTPVLADPPGVFARNGVAAPAAAASGLLSLLAAAGAFLYHRLGNKDDRFAGMPPGTFPPPGQRAEVVKNEIPDEDIPVAFSPPAIPVAEGGLLIDATLDTRETAATLIDLAVRGGVRIVEDQGVQYAELIEPRVATIPHEQALMTGLFPGLAPGTRTTLARGKVGDNTMFNAHNATVAAVRAQVAQQGWYQRMPSPGRGRPGGGSNARSFLGCLVILVFFGFSGFASFVTAIVGGGSLKAVVVIVPLVAIVGGLIVISKIRGRGRRSAVGRAVDDQVLGFRKYLATAEADQLRFEEGEDIFSRYLPWAIAFDLADRWQKVCEQLVSQGRIPAQPSWYYGPNYYANPFLFSSFASNMQSSFSPPPSPPSSGGGGGSSSGFGGGGSSGGGGGGGGGGSW